MPDYFHSALRGEQIHEAKIKVLPEDSTMPVPQWEGQLLAVGTRFYYSIKQNNTLIWSQPSSLRTPVLPAGTVKFESGFDNPPAPRTSSESGIIYLNSNTKDIWYLNNGGWIKLGASSGNPINFEIIPNRSAQDWQGNYFGFWDPSVASGEQNCLLISKFESNKKYYLALKCPSISQYLSLATDNNNFYLELWRGYEKQIISTALHNTDSLAILDSGLLTLSPSGSDFRLGMYVLRNQTKQRINFLFDFESRLIQPRGFSQEFYSY